MDHDCCSKALCNVVSARGPSPTIANGTDMKNAVIVTNPNTLGGVRLDGSSTTLPSPPWGDGDGDGAAEDDMANLDRTARSAKLRLLSMAVANANHEKDRSFRHAYPTPPTTGNSVKYTGIGIHCPSNSADTIALKNGSNAFTMCVKETGPAPKLIIVHN